MRLLVFVKQVPDTAIELHIGADGKSISSDGVSYVLNPYDEFALEEALRIKEKIQEGEVVAITMGKSRAKEALRSCLAMGADRAIHLSDNTFEGSDSYATSLVLSRIARQVGFDIILCGKQAVDGDTAHVGSQVAEMLGIPHVSIITKFSLNDDKKSAVVHRQIEGGTEVLEVPLPALFTAHKGLNEPRYPTLKGIMGAKKKEILEMSADKIGETKEFGINGSRSSIVSITTPDPRPPGRILKGEIQDTVKEVVKLLREEAKVI